MLVSGLIWLGMGSSAIACEPTHVAEAVRELTRLRNSGPANAVEATQRARALEQGLECSVHLIEQGQLVAFYQEAGTAAVTAKIPMDALRWFTEACRVSPDATWDVRLGTQAGAVWQQAQKGCASIPEGVIRTEGPTWIDGRMVRTGESVTVKVGEHLVQTINHCDGAVGTTLITVAEGPEVPIGGFLDQLCVAPPPPPPVEIHTGRVAASLGLTALGTVTMGTSAYLTARFGRPTYVNPRGYGQEEALVTGLLYGGALMVGVGVVGVTLSPDGALIPTLRSTF